MGIPGRTAVARRAEGSCARKEPRARQLATPARQGHPAKQQESGPARTRRWERGTRKTKNHGVGGTAATTFFFVPDASVARRGVPGSRPAAARACYGPLGRHSLASSSQAPFIGQSHCITMRASLLSQCAERSSRGTRTGAQGHRLATDCPFPFPTTSRRWASLQKSTTSVSHPTTGSE